MDSFSKALALYLAELEELHQKEMILLADPTIINKDQVEYRNVTQDHIIYLDRIFQLKKVWYRARELARGLPDVTNQPTP